MAPKEILAALVALWVALAPALAFAQVQDYPNRAVTLIVAFPPGGGTDLVARLLSAKLSDGWGKPVPVENRGGAQGAVASAYVAKQPADGYTLLVTITGAMAASQYLFPNLAYDPFRDFAAVTLLASTPLGIATNSSLPYRTIGDFVEHARKNRVPYGSAGHGSITHIIGELFNLNYGTKLMHVPYKGSGPAVQDLLGGHIQMVVQDIGSLKTHIDAGKMRLLGYTGSKRSAVFPDVPTFAESGYAGFDVGGWFGVYAPAGTPKPVLERVAAAMTRIIRSPETSQRMVGMGWDPGGGTPDEFFAVWKASADRLSDIIRRAKIKVD